MSLSARAAAIFVVRSRSATNNRCTPANIRTFITLVLLLIAAGVQQIFLSNHCTPAIILLDNHCAGTAFFSSRSVTNNCCVPSATICCSRSTTDNCCTRAATNCSRRSATILSRRSQGVCHAPLHLHKGQDPQC